MVVVDNLIGQHLGPYRIVERIGEGGMAQVYKAYQPALDRYVAVKVLPPIHAKQPGFSERFLREAKAIANLNHPNILPVYDSGQEQGYSFLVMRYVHGARTLREVMAQPLSLPQIADWIGQVAAALDHAHRQGVIHRDVKPSNVLIDDNWALLTDFGLAKMTEASAKLTGTGVGVGTPAYMSPEQGQGGEVDPRTDIYSLGVILFEMLTGQVPHDAETPLAIILKRITEPLPLPKTLNPDIPPAVEQVVLRALDVDPEDRFRTAGELAAALKQAVAEMDDGSVAPTLSSPAVPPLTTYPGATSVETAPPAPSKPKRAWLPWLLLAVVSCAALTLVAGGLALYAVLLARPAEGTATATAVGQAARTVTPTPSFTVIPTSTSTPTPVPAHTPARPPTLTFAPAPSPTPTARVIEMVEKDLGVVLYSQAPKTWTIDVPADFTKVEVAVYGAGKDETNQYGGWKAYLQINGAYVWEFLRYDADLGGVIYNHMDQKEIEESAGRGQYLDVTSMVTAGRNSITYYHYTEGDGIGVKIKIHH